MGEIRCYYCNEIYSHLRYHQGLPCPKCGMVAKYCDNCNLETKKKGEFDGGKEK